MNFAKMLLAVALVAGLPAWLVPAGGAEQDATLLIAGFENGAGPIKADGKIVAENASEGKHALKIEHPGSGSTGFALADKAILAKFKHYAFFKVDVFNPQDHPVHFGVRIDDAKSKDFGSRFNDERGGAAAPGWSTYELNLSGLRKSNSKNFALQEKVDMNSLKLLRLSLGPKSPACVLYFDNLRLEASGLVTVEGLRALDFGPAKSDVYPGFEACNENNVWGKGAEFGWIHPQVFDNVYMPDSLAGDYGSGDEFKIKLPNGKYEVHLCIDPFGFWGSYPRFHDRQLTLNGKVVLDQTITPQEFLDKCLFLHEDEEDLPGEDLYEKYIAPRNVPRMYPVEVTDGMLSVKLDSDTKFGKFIQYLVVYPESKQAEGRKWMQSLAKQRKDAFNRSMIVSLPPKAAMEVQPTAEDVACGFVPFTAATENYVYVNTAADPAAVHAPIVFQVAKGERANGQLGLYPVKDVSGVTVAVSDLSGPGGAKIASSAVIVRKARNFLKREHRTRVGDLLPLLLQSFTTLDLKPGITRAVWLTLITPADAAPGQYTGTITIGARGAAASIPVKVTVYPFALDKVTDITFSATGARCGVPSYLAGDLPYEFLKSAECVMKDMADHGLNAVTGGQGFGPVLTGIHDSKADIDYTYADHWMALARKYGLTMPGDSYQDFDVKGVPHETKKNSIENLNATAQKKFGVSYPELIKIVYEDVARHAKAKNWPQRSYYFLDEPRPEFGNIQFAAELIKIRTAASPSTLFSGYYSPGQGRDVYFQTMPISISHTSKLALKLTAEAGKELWEYNGSRTRASAGRFVYVAARAGLKGYLTNGYMYVASDPYFDFSDDEAAWCVVWPSKHGVTDSVPWERVSDGINDYRYLSTLERLVKKARLVDKAQADAAEAFINDQLKSIDLDNRTSANLTGPQFDEFRKTAAIHIAALAKAIGE